MTATATTLFVGEKLSLIGWAGIAALAAGVLLLSARGGRDLAKIDRRAVGFALLTALTICAYSVVDGIGARLRRQSEVPMSLSLFVGIALVLVPYALCRDGRDVIPAMQRYLAARLRRRRLAGAVLRHRAVGDDAGADRHRRHACARPACCSARRSPSSCSRSRCAPRASRAALLILCGLVLIRLQ